MGTSEPPTHAKWPNRKAMIRLCERGRVKQSNWTNRDSGDAQSQLGQCWALLSAGCAFEVDEEISGVDVVQLDITYHGFNYFEEGREDVSGFYVPTEKAIDDAAGADWY